MELLIMGRVTGDKVVMEMFKKAPAVFRRVLLGWLWKESEMFIGTKKTNGIVRQKLLEKKTWAKAQQWRTSIVNLFTGKVVDYLSGRTITMKTADNLGGGAFGRGFSMMAKMGVFYTKKKKVHEAMEFLEQSGTIDSSKYMPIPIKGSNMSTPYAKFKAWASENKFRFIFKNGLILYYLKDKLMFVGRRVVHVKFAHQFNRLFNSYKPGIDGRAAAAVDKAAVAAGRT
jgi:hypothetical protein